MDVTQFAMPADQAREKFEAYRAALKVKHDKVDEDLCRAYEAMSKGTVVLDLLSTLREAGVTDSGWPALAIAQATRDFVFWRGLYRGGGSFYWETTGRWGSPTEDRTKRIVVPDQTFSAQPTMLNGRAMVPHVPPELRPTRGLTSYHILFEAEWDDVAPVDPFLLKRLGPPGSMLFGIIAHWDLTELERAVLARHLLTGVS
jgi:hypothetical protein